MIEKMKHVSIMGNMKDIDVIIETYLSKYDIQLENASSEISGNVALLPMQITNPYANILHKAEKFTSALNWDFSDIKTKSEITNERAEKVIEVAYQAYEKRDNTIKDLEGKRETLIETIKSIEPFLELDFKIESLDNFEWINYRFGRLPVSNFKQFETFLYDDPEILFVISMRDKNYIWGIYFVPEVFRDKVDSIFSSLHFEVIQYNNTFDGKRFDGTPREIRDQLIKTLNLLNEKIDKLTAETMKVIDFNKNELLAACLKIKQTYALYDAKKLAARTVKDYFIFCGWMTERDSARLEAEIDEDERVVFIKEDKADTDTPPPTKLKNPPIIRFFELFVRMYGLPSYNEIDPTPFIAVTYTLLFGVMFSDLGQGAVLALIGYLLYKIKKIDLGAIVCVIGCSSMVFGFLFGSFFGFEELIPAVLPLPSENINATLILAISLGCIMIFMVMLINIVKHLKNKNWGKLLFGPNGIVGMVFYFAVIAVVVSVLLSLKAAPILTSLPFIVVFIAVPLLLIAFSETIIKRLEGHKKLIESGPALFVLETIIELFEVLLTYFTNTVSFVRVGAFALSHAGMMSVVMLLSKTSAGSHNPVILILGNILVLALEGLVVGIQVLRLQFYEMFSRFYEGSGTEFVSYK